MIPMRPRQGGKVTWKAAGKQIGFIVDNRKPPREFNAPLEVSHHHFLETPPSHFTPQKVKGYVFDLLMGAIII